MVDEMMTPGPITRPVLQKPSLFTQARPNATYPAFETLVLGKSKGRSEFKYIERGFFFSFIVFLRIKSPFFRLPPLP